MSVISDKSIYVNAVGQSGMLSLLASACGGPFIGVYLRSYVTPDCIGRTEWDDLGANFIDPLNQWSTTNFVDLTDYMASPLRPGASDTPVDIIRQNSSSITYLNGALTFPNTSVTPSAPTRALGTTYQNTSGKVLRVTPSIEVSATSLLLTGSKIKVELMSDSAATPTTVRGTVGQSVAGVLSLTNSNTIPVSYDVPPNHYYRTLTTQVSGGASGSSATLVTWTEEVRT